MIVINQTHTRISMGHIICSRNRLKSQNKLPPSLPQKWQPEAAFAADLIDNQSFSPDSSDAFALMTASFDRQILAYMYMLACLGTTGNDRCMFNDSNIASVIILHHGYLSIIKQCFRRLLHDVQQILSLTNIISTSKVVNGCPFLCLSGANNSARIN